MTAAYHAANRLVMTRADLAAIGSDAVGDVRLRPHPAARLLVSRFPVGTIWSSHQEATLRPVAAWTGETVLVTRPDIVCQLTILPAGDGPFAAAIHGGARLGEAAEAAATDPAFDFGRALLGLVDCGAFDASREGDA